MKSKLEEYMDVVDWLNGYRRALFHAQRLEEEIMRWEEKAQKITASTSSVVSVSKNRTPRAALALEMIEHTEVRLVEAKANCIKTRAEIEQVISSLKEENQQKVIYCIYIDCLRQYEAAEKLNYSRQHIARIHSSAMDEIKKMLHNVT